MKATTFTVALACAALALWPSHTLAATADTTGSAGSLTVVQTSALNGLAPGVAPIAIVGLITNTGPDPVAITAVEVEITSVTLAPGAASGTCGPSDYVLLNARMPVDRTIDARGGSTEFRGASIGFDSTGDNQDACQLATVQLLYTVLSSSAPLARTGLSGDPGVILGVAVTLLVAGVALGSVERRRWRIALPHVPSRRGRGSPPAGHLRQ